MISAPVGLIAFSLAHGTLSWPETQHLRNVAGLRGPMVLSAEVAGGALLSIQRGGEEIAGKTLEFVGTETLDG